MAAAIVFQQGNNIGSAGQPLIVVPGDPVVCTSDTPASIYFWRLLDTPIRSNVARTLTSTSNRLMFTPDVPGTYLVSLKLNNSGLSTDNATSFCAILTSGPGRLGWRYRAAGEAEEDTITSKDLDGNDLGFPNAKNPRGWATRDDIEREQVEHAIYDVRQATDTPTPGIASLVKLQASTGKLNPQVLPVHIHQQQVAAATWVISHNLGYHPAIIVEDSVGDEVIGDIRHVSNSVAHVMFSAPFSGMATCR